MRLAAYQEGERPARDAQIRAGVLLPDGGCLDLAKASGGSLPFFPGELLALDGWHQQVAEAVAGADAADAVGTFTLVAPQPAPTKIVAVGLNYAEHAGESKLAVPSSPVLFAKWPNAIVGPGAEIRLPEGLEGQEVDYEIELAAVIGRRCVDVTPDQALDFVGGYTVANDISARNVQTRDGQWTFAKSFDTFCPVGPWIVTRDEIADPNDLDMWLQVNGVTRQRANTRHMVFKVAELISYLSKRMTLFPGDLLLTGTPAGVALGMETPTWLAHGDEIRCCIEGLGELVNRVIAGRRTEIS